MIEGIVIDLDGVLTSDRNLTLFPDACSFWAYLKGTGIPFAIATNNSRIPPASIAEALRKGGLDVEERQIVSPLSLAPGILRDNEIRTLFLLGEDSLMDYFRSCGFEIRSDPYVDAVVVGLDRGLDFLKLKMAATALKQNGAMLMGLNSNRLARDDDGLVFPGVGVLTEMLAASVQMERKPCLPGKMSETYNRILFRKLAAPPERLAVLSDDLPTDIAGYGSLGLATIFISTGKYSREEALSGAYGERPDRAVSSLSEIVAMDLLRQMGVDEEK